MAHVLRMLVVGLLLTGGIFLANESFGQAMPASLEDRQRSYVVFTPKDRQLFVTYYINEEGRIFGRMEDPLRAGELLQVTHHLALKAPKEKGWANQMLSSKTLRAVTYTRYLKYDPLQNKYAFGSDPAKLSFSMTREEAQRAAFSGQKVAVMENTEGLVSGKTYTLGLKIRFAPADEADSWLNLLSFKQFWEPQTMEATVEYIVP